MFSLRNPINVFLVCIFVYSLNVSIRAAPSKTTPAPPKTKTLANGTVITAPPNCRKMMLAMAKKQMKVVKICFDEVKAQYPDKEEMNKHFQCVIKCALMREDMLDANFKITTATVQNFLDKHIQKDYHSVAHAITGGCLKEWAPKFDPAEPTCMAYGDFIKCLQEYVGDFC